MEFCLNLDNHIVIKDNSGNPQYEDAVQNFNLDSGLIASLPENMAALNYTDNITVYYDAKQNAYPVEGSYCPDMVTSAISSIDAICAAKTTREHDAAVAKAAKEAEEAALLLQAAIAEAAMNQPITTGTQAL
jgi:hypothetical protein